MKNTLFRLLSALLALCMVTGILTTVLTETAVSSFADETEEGGEEGDEDEEEVKEITAEDIKNTPYVSEEDKLLTMSKKTDTGLLDQFGNIVYEYAPYKVYGDYELYVQELTGEVAVKNTATGQVLFTNPYDACLSLQGDGGIKTKLPMMMSQLVVNFENITTGKSEVMNSFEYSACFNQIQISDIRNGLCVEYTIGRADERRLVPIWMEKYRFEKVILSRIDDEYAYIKMMAYYATLISLNEWDHTGVSGDSTMAGEWIKQYKKLGVYNADNPYVSEDYDPTLEAEYQERRANGEIAVPYKGSLAMRVYGNRNNYEMNKIESWIRSFVPEYNYDTLQMDHEITGYEGSTTASPSFKMALEYTLDKDGLTVRMPANSISFDEDTLRLRSIMILPYMGAGSDENTGYIFVPDGSGTVIRFEDFTTTAVTFSSGTMYGPDNSYHTLPNDYSGHEEKIRYPIFGVVEDQTRTFELVTDEETGEKKPTTICPHRFVESEVVADCTLGVDGGIYTYCVICGYVSEIRNATPYRHKWKSNAKTVVKRDCHHYDTIDGVCETCLNYYNNRKTLISSSGSAEDIAKFEEEFSYLKEYTGFVDLAAGLGDHKFDDYQYVNIDGVCYGRVCCSVQYELTDENGEVVLDEEGNPVMVVCGEVDKSIEGANKDGYISMLEEYPETNGHDYGDISAVAAYNKDGFCCKDVVCTQCGTETTIQVEHTVENAEVVVDTTAHRCYSSGTCTVCGESVVVDGMHEYGEKTKVSADGHCYEEQVCTKCGYVDHVEVEHNYNSDPVYSDENGLCKESYVCADCGAEFCTYSKHSGIESEVKYDTVNHVCYREETCNHCGTVTVKLVGHIIVNGICSECGYELPEGCTEGRINVDGQCYRTFFKADGSELDASLRVAVDHLFGNEQNDGVTCTSELHFFFVCSCGYVAGEYTVENDNPDAHTYEWVFSEGDVNDKDVCLKGYTKKYVCKYCGVQGPEEDISGIGHMYGTPVRYTDNVYLSTCTICGHEHYGPLPGSEPEEDAAPEAPAAAEGEGEEEPEDNTQTAVFTRGYVAIMTEGSTLATLAAETGGLLNKYCRTYITVNPRPQDSYNLRDSISTGADAEWTVVSERKYTGSYTFRYFMLQSVDEETAVDTGLADSKYDASYAGMADVYRTYLQQKGMLTDLEKTDDNIPLYLEAFGAISVNSTFLTFPTTEKKALTSFENLEKVLDSLSGEENGITNINVRLNGFTNGGMNPTMPYKVEFEKAVGGDKAFGEFVDYANEKGFGVYPDFDFAYSHKDKNFDGFKTKKHAVKTIDDRYIVKKDYDSTLQLFSATGLLAVSSSVYDLFYTKFSESMNKIYSTDGKRGISVASLGTDLNSDFDKDEPFNREDSREFTEELLAKLQSDYDSVMIDGGNAYAMGYADHILNMSLVGSEYLNSSSSVPFVAMVLHGSKQYAGSATNMASSMSQELLHIIENGASPYFIIATENTSYLKEDFRLSKYYSLDYSTWEGDMIAAYKELNEVLGDVKYAKFIGHEYVSGTRVPDADEVSADCRRIIDIITKAIKSYEAAKMRADNAQGLYDRKFVNGITDSEAEIEAIIAKYTFSDDPVNESVNDQTTVSAADKAAIKALLDKIKSTSASADADLMKTLKANITAANKALETETAAFESTMAKYAIYFDVAEEDRMNPAAYNEKSFVGSVYEKDGKYIVPTDGALDTDGTKITSDYSIDDYSIVKVTYDNGVEIYLNYNYFDVIVNVNGENVRINSYKYVKTSTKGEA